MNLKITTIIAVCMAAIMGLFLGFVYFPEKNEIRRLSFEIEELRREEKELSGMDKELARIKEELVKNSLAWEEGRESFLTFEEVEDIKREIEKLRGVKRVFLPIEKENFYEKMGYKIELRGSYDYFLRLLSRMVYPGKLVIPTSVKVSFERGRWGTLILLQTLYISEE